MNANIGKRIQITLQIVTLHKMLISVKLNLESLIIREDACGGFLSQLKVIMFFVFTYISQNS